MKTLILDIETSPNIQFGWDLKPNWTSHKAIIQNGGILSMAWKEYGKDKVYTAQVDHRDPYNDEALLRLIRDELDGVDLVITQNGDKFDLRKINRGLLLYRLDPLPPIMSADIIKITRREFNLNSYSLDAVAKELGLGGKTHTEYEWWTSVCNPLPVVSTKERKDALDKIVAYNADDVLLTEKVYDVVKPYAGRHPSINLVSGEEDACPTCGAGALKTNESWIHRAVTRAYPRFRCDECGAWCRGTRSLGGVNHRSI